MVDRGHDPGGEYDLHKRFKVAYTIHEVVARKYCEDDLPDIPRIPDYVVRVVANRADEPNADEQK